MTLFEVRHPGVKLLVIIAIVFLLSQLPGPGHRPLYVDRMIELQKAALTYAGAHGGVFPNTVAELIGTTYLKDKRNYGTVFDFEKLSYLPPAKPIASPISKASNDIPLMIYKTENLTTSITIGGKIKTEINSRQ